MDPIIDKITDYVLVIRPDLDRNDFLDFVVRDVVDRSLVYMNRVQLVDQYEKDIIDPDIDPSSYIFPLPKELERALATTVVSVYKNVQTMDNSAEQAVKRIKDNGQEVEYMGKITNYLSSTSDSELFSGVTVLLDRYKIPTVINNPGGYCEDYWGRRYDSLSDSIICY